MKRGLVLAACGLLAVSGWAQPTAFAADTAGTKESPAAKAASDKPLAPEFGPSVVFDAKNDVPVQLSDLRGKMTVIVFFQSWCPKCNVWSPEMFQQITKAFGDDRSVALVAMKTDGGILEAKAYLKEKNRADLTKWIVCADPNAAYYQRVTGSDKLFGYAIIGPDGRLAATGQAGSYFGGEGAKQFVLADPKLKTKHAPDAAPILPADADYAADLAPVVRVAEMGNFRMAMQGAKIFAGRAKTKEAAAKLQTDLLATLSKRVETWTKQLQETDPAAKYEAYRGLRAVSTMTDVEPGKTAKAALAAVKADKELPKEEKAEAAFWAMINKASRMALAQRQAQLPPALKQFAAAYKGTVYAERALAEAETIGSAPAAK